MSRPRVLVVGGTDSSGGAGIQADVRAMVVAGADAVVAVTAVTAQTMSEVRVVEPVAADVLRAQIEAAAQEPVHAVKVGLLPTAELVAVAAELLGGLAVPVVVDPVLRASSGPGLALDTVVSLRGDLLPVATVVTPNVSELSILVGDVVDDLSSLGGAAAALVDAGPDWVLATGAHLPGPEVVDVLTDGQRLVELSGPRITTEVRGTGCTLASLLAAGLAAGQDVVDAARTAREQLSEMFGTLSRPPTGPARFGPG
jgi:hydroxymethylpyrimidine/phosphomethylpyrimidine kinase